MNETNAGMTSAEECINESNECAASIWTEKWIFNNRYKSLSTTLRDWKNSLELNGWAMAAINEAERNGLQTTTKHREPPASGARVMERDGLS
ncbi:hypothetical protein J1N10_04495 [Carboxylicivirga sp. A043]|uniref:hypothetical protein n=1 Tax=Carboxylicivirga litoralis TaxID=2816963 RepID=UPI0021CB771A|nr:hypothetical protein [Carboxylicivirga sp. A043]MCU4155221.1 hypothetical protein [Carboxylicivirga sp. A043]